MLTAHGMLVNKRHLSSGKHVTVQQVGSLFCLALLDLIGYADDGDMSFSQPQEGIAYNGETK